MVAMLLELDEALEVAVVLVVVVVIGKGGEFEAVVVVDEDAAAADDEKLLLDACGQSTLRGQSQVWSSRLNRSPPVQDS